MNEDLLEQLRAIFGPEPAMPRRRTTVNVDSINRSPLADSLRRVLPGMQVRAGAMPAGVVGEWPWGQNVVRMTANPRAYGTRRAGASMVPPASERQADMDPRGVLLHEAGHGFAEKRGHPAMLSFERANAAAPERIVERDRVTIGRQTPQTPEQEAMLALNSYSARDPSERGKETYAQAFANAWDYLSRTAYDQTRTPRQLLAEYERTAPGTGTLVMELLKEPVFAEHPFRAGFPADLPPRR